MIPFLATQYQKRLRTAYDELMHRVSNSRSAGMMEAGKYYECQTCETITLIYDECPDCGSTDLEPLDHRP